MIGLGDKASDTSQGLINLLSPRFPHRAIASINYRLSSLDNNVKHPLHNRDVATAVNFLLDHPYPEYDKDQIILIGHSVGAFMCLSVSGLLSTYPDTRIKNPKAVVGLGLIDRIYDLRELKEYPSYTFVKDVIKADGHPCNWNSVSPTHWSLAQSGSAWPKILVIHSKDDTLLTTRQSQLMIDHFNQLARNADPVPKPSIEVDFDSVKGDHDELLKSPALADRLLKWIKPSST